MISDTGETSMRRSHDGFRATRARALAPILCGLLFAGGAGSSRGQEFRIGEWRAYALVGPPSLQEGTQYVSFSGHHGLQENWLPNGAALDSSVQGDAALLSRFQLRVVNLGWILPGYAGDPLGKQIGDLVLSSLVRAGYEVASRANDHALDRGTEPLTYYEKKLTEAGLQIIGERKYPVFHWQAGKSRIDICAVAGVIDNPDPGKLILTTEDADIALLKKATEGADFRIAFAILGSASRYPSPFESRQVDKLIDAGFGLVVCTGNHFTKGFVMQRGTPVAYGIGDHLLSIDYPARTDAEPIGMHLVAGFDSGRLAQVFVLPFHNDLRHGRLGPLDEPDFQEFVKTLRDRSTSDTGKYFSESGAFKEMMQGIKKMGPEDLKKLRPRHIIYGVRLVVHQRPWWVVGAGVLFLGAIVLYWRRKVRRRLHGKAAGSPAGPDGI